jgi:hypothetical protein
MKVSLKRCGDMAVGKPVIVEDCLPWYASLWWKDVCSIGTNLNNNWFAQNVVKKLGNDTHTSFWDDIWVSNLPLKDRFPRLFSISTQKEAMVGVATGKWRNIYGEVNFLSCFGFLRFDFAHASLSLFGFQ